MELCFHKSRHILFVFSVNGIRAHRWTLSSIVFASPEEIKSFHTRRHTGILQIALEAQTFSTNIDGGTAGLDLWAGRLEWSAEV